MNANAGLTINGVLRSGKFAVPEATALAWLQEPNPSGVANSDVLRPIYGADDLGGRWSGEWATDFGNDRSKEDAAAYVEPFSCLEENDLAARLKDPDKKRRPKWWLMARPRPEMRRMLDGHARYLVTGESMVQRFFCWLPFEVLPDHKLVVIDADDDYTMGILESHIHRAWARALSSKQGVVNNDVYPASRIFGTFPFPEPTDARRATVADAARELNALRENWLNPPEWTQEETLVFPATVGGPWDAHIPPLQVARLGEGGRGERPENGTIAEAHYRRRVARPTAKAMVAARTLTKLYNERPAWLRNAHAKLDAAVAEAYGLPADLPDADLLAELLRLNLARSTSL